VGVGYLVFPSGGLRRKSNINNHNDVQFCGERKNVGKNSHEKRKRNK
jgi:hypothetical protein